MAKKVNNKQIFFLAALFFGAVAIAMFFLPFVKYRIGNDTAYTEALFSGFNCAFSAEKIQMKLVLGDSSASAGLMSTKLVPVALIVGILLVVAVVAALLTKIVDKKKVFIVKVVAAGLFVASAILAVALVKASFISVNELENVKDDFNVGIGAILTCVFSALAGAGIFLS